MPLIDVNLPVADAAPPADVQTFLAEAERRIEHFQRSARVPAFVPSDFERVYQSLRTVEQMALAPGRRVCEWGSGFGVVASLAAMLDFDAYGIEIEPELVDAARQLARDFDLPVEFVSGSFIPVGGEHLVDAGSTFAWLTPDSGTAYDDIGLDPDDFDVVFAYPWPDEEHVIWTLFERFASTGAVLITYHGSDDIRVQRKTQGRSRHRRRSDGRVRT
jgi:predicted O-methyltransferase YrrM